MKYYKSIVFTALFSICPIFVRMKHSVYRFETSEEPKVLLLFVTFSIFSVQLKIFNRYFITFCIT